MSNQARKSSPKHVLLAMLIVLLWITLNFLTPVTVSALPGAFVDNIYYSDATHAVEVGERIIYCNGQRESWGVTSSFIVSYSEPCSCIHCDPQ